MTPIKSSNPFPATPSTNNSDHHPIMLARLFHRSAFSTNPNMGGRATGTIGGGGTPGGDARALAALAACARVFSAMASPMASSGPARGDVEDEARIFASRADDDA